MESRYNINEIIAQVGDIGALISRMKTDGPIPAIEVDIVLEKIRKLYNDLTGLKEAPHKAEMEVKEPVEAKKAKPPKQTEVPAKSHPTQETEPRQKAEPVAGSQAPQEPATLADKFKGEKKFINERLADNGNRQDLSSKLQSKPIRNIGTSLGLNDRFKLINELFNGDKDSYQQTIDILDSASNFNEAFNYISTSYEWDMEDDAVLLLLDLVRRKFIVNKDE